MRTFEVNTLRVWFDDVRSDVACDIEQLLIVLDGVVVVNGRIFILIFIRKVAFFQLNNALHQRVMKMKFQFGMVSKIVCHNYFLFIPFNSLYKLYAKYKANNTFNTFEKMCLVQSASMVMANHIFATTNAA